MESGDLWTICPLDLKGFKLLIVTSRGTSKNFRIYSLGRMSYTVYGLVMGSSGNKYEVKFTKMGLNPGYFMRPSYTKSKMCRG